VNEPIPPTAERTTTIERPVIPPAADAPHVDLRDDDRGHRNPLEDVTPERPKTHPVAYAALGLAALALLLSLFGLRSNDDGGFRQVKVGNADCVIGPQDNGPDVLFCRTGAVPPG
jgi:hypothetical protein